MFSMNCPVDFDSDFWTSFDAAISEEWNITATTGCHEIGEFPSSLQEYKDIAKILMERDANLTSVAGTTDTAAYFDGLLDQSDPIAGQVVFLTKHSMEVFQKPVVSGVAYMTENMAFVENNFEYSTAAVSHELLHLVLQEEGYEKSCYADKVHENQFQYSLKQIGDNMRPVIKKFGC